MQEAKYIYKSECIRDNKDDIFFDIEHFNPNEPAKK